MIWNQNYNPLGWWPLSTLVSALPVATLFFVLLVLRKRVWVSACCGFVMAVVLAAAVFDMPAPLIAAAGVEGEGARTIELREHSVGTILKGWSPFALQSIVVASTACRLEGREADVWKAVFWHSLVLASLVGLVVLTYAYAAPWVIPG